MPDAGVVGKELGRELVQLLDRHMPADGSLQEKKQVRAEQDPKSRRRDSVIILSISAAPPLLQLSFYMTLFLAQVEIRAPNVVTARYAASTNWVWRLAVLTPA